MKRMLSLEEELSNLLGIVCVEWGFCISAAAAEPIETRGSITDSEFASAVLTAEGLTPPEYSQWYEPLKRRFREHFGRASMKAEDFER